MKPSNIRRASTDDQRRELIGLAMDFFGIALEWLHCKPGGPAQLRHIRNAAENHERALICLEKAL
jgi:hypothetical protein